MHVTACSDVLHRCKYLHAMQGLACQSRDVGVFLKTGFPKSLCAANVAKIALSTSKPIYHT